MHLKRSKAEKEWPIPRKGTTYIALSSHAQKTGMSVLMILRDLLKIAKTRKEARYLTLGGDIKINGKVRKSENFPVQFYDVITLDKIKKSYRLNIVHKKFKLEEVSATEANSKIVKIIGKITLDKKTTQINLEDGTNLIYDKPFNVNDSVILNLKSGGIDKILPLKEGAKVEITSGKHAGEKGTLKEIILLERTKRYQIKLSGGEVGLPIQTIFVIG